MKEAEPKTRLVIKEMPDKEILEAFVNGLNGATEVYFDIKEGKFMWSNPSKAQKKVGTE